MILSKEMLKEFVEGASAQKIKDFAFKLIEQLTQPQLNALEQGFKVTLHWQGGDTPELAKPVRAPVMEPQARPRGRPPKLAPEIPMDEDMEPEPEETDDEENVDELLDEDKLFKNIDKTLAQATPKRKPVDETEREFERVIGNVRRQTR